jgi:hypothetical protein
MSFNCILSIHFAVADIFIRGLGPLDQDFTYFLILQETRHVYKNIVIPNNINIITLISRYFHMLILTLFIPIKHVMRQTQNSQE